MMTADGMVRAVLWFAAVAVLIDFALRTYDAWRRMEWYGFMQYCAWMVCVGVYVRWAVLK